MTTQAILSSPEHRDPAASRVVVWRLAAGVSSLITMTADLLGCMAYRDQLLADVLRHGLDNLTIGAAIDRATNEGDKR